VCVSGIQGSHQTELGTAETAAERESEKRLEKREERDRACRESCMGRKQIIVANIPKAVEELEVNKAKAKLK
jgi:hypothetical protein